MTTFMTFSVYSLRISSDMPVESNFVPMVTLYFILSISYTFLSFIWFIIANEFITKNNMPNSLANLACVIKSVLFWKFDKAPFWQRKILPKYESGPKAEDKCETKPTNKEPNDKMPQPELSKPETPIKSPCNNCNICESCLKEKGKEKDKKNKKDTNESNVSALNHLVGFIMLLIVVACNATTWLLISNPPPNF